MSWVHFSMRAVETKTDTIDLLAPHPLPPRFATSTCLSRCCGASGGRPTEVGLLNHDSNFGGCVRSQLGWLELVNNAETWRMRETGADRYSERKQTGGSRRSRKE